MCEDSIQNKDRGGEQVQLHEGCDITGEERAHTEHVQ